MYTRTHLSLEAADLRVLVLDGDAQALDRDGLLHEDRLVRVHAQLQSLRLLADLGDVLGDGWRGRQAEVEAARQEVEKNGSEPPRTTRPRETRHGRMYGWRRVRE